MNALQEKSGISSRTDEKKYPIAEIFTSPQGEGLYTGTLMTFIRFAGCSVGKKLSKEFYNGSPREVKDVNSPGGYRIERSTLPIYTEQCCTYDGRTFLCDTDFRTKEVLTTDEILNRIPDGVEHVCLTGGEPLIHDLVPLVVGLKKFFDERLGIKFHMPCIHVETSGTVEIPKDFYLDEGYVWITVSPKLGVLDDVLDCADEIKLLVDSSFDESKLPDWFKERDLLSLPIWVQPINAELSIDRENMFRVLELQKKHPSWRISTQMHKIWNVR